MTAIHDANLFTSASAGGPYDAKADEAEVSGVHIYDADGTEWHPGDMTGQRELLIARARIAAQDKQLATAQARVEELEEKINWHKQYEDEMREAYDDALQQLPRGRASMMPQFLTEEQTARLEACRLPDVAALVAEAARETEQVTGVSVEQAARHFRQSEVMAAESIARCQNKMADETRAREHDARQQGFRAGVCYTFVSMAALMIAYYLTTL